MHVYQIVLEVGNRLEARDYRGSPTISWEEAQWIFDFFPFEEPEYFRARPDEGPAPQILFANLRNQSILLVRYCGKERYDYVLALEKGQPFFQPPVEAEVIKEAIRIFWTPDQSGRQIARTLLGKPFWWGQWWSTWWESLRPLDLGGKRARILPGFRYLLNRTLLHPAYARYSSHPRFPFRKPS